MATRTAFGKEVIGVQWAGAEFAARGRIWELGLPVPTRPSSPETEMLMEFIGTPRTARPPRLADARPPRALLPALFDQLREVMLLPSPSRAGRTVTCRPTTSFLDGERLVVIDWPQIVDIVGNPHGQDFLHRDAVNVCSWFTARGMPPTPSLLFGDLMAAAVS